MNNPFEYFQSMMNQENFNKNMAGMNMFNMGMPNMDLSTLSSTVRNNAEMFTTTNQLAADNIQNILKKGSENLQETTTEMYNTMKDAVSSGDISQITNCQQKYIQTVLDNNFNSTKEIIEATTKSMMDMLTMMQSNMKDTTTKAFTKAKKVN